jgi:hypothetical protein
MLKRIGVVLALTPLMAGCTIEQRTPAFVELEPPLPSMAHSIADAFQHGDAKQWRLMMLKEIEKIRTLPVPALEELLAGYRKQVTERGAQGLEAPLLAATKELAARGLQGRAAAYRHLGELAKVYKVSDKRKKIKRPNAVCEDSAIIYADPWVGGGPLPDNPFLEGGL